MYGSYKNKAKFFIVYVSEAHANQLKKLGCNEKKPTTLEEKAIVARKFVKGAIEGKDVTIPILLGDMDGIVEKAYTPLPARTIIVGKDGKIAYSSKPSPGGASTRLVRGALKKVFGEPEAPAADD